MTDPELSLVVADLVKLYQDGNASVTAVNDVSFDVRDGDFYTLLGPSGCGKTTTLRCVAGLERHDAGRIVIGGRVVSEGGTRSFVPPQRRDIGMVFQSYGIWPHMTVFENAAFPLRVSRPRPRRTEIQARVEEALATVRLAGYEGRMATQLSGGQQQRLSLARALVRRPRMLLLDEPLSNLDAKLREAMRVELRELQRRLGVTTLYVTHDQQEALSMSNRIAVMHDGRIVQEGSPREIYLHPATRFVADFVGTTNLLEATVIGPANNGLTALQTALGDLQVTGDGTGPGSKVAVSIRPECVDLRQPVPGGDLAAGSGDNTFTGTVESVMFLGEVVECHVRAGEATIVVHQRAGDPVQVDETVWIRLPEDRCTLVSDGN